MTDTNCSLCPCSPGSTLTFIHRHRRPHDLITELLRQGGDGQVIGRQADCELLRGSDFRIARDLLRGHGQMEVPGEECVGLLPIVELIVMGARVAVFVPGERGLFTVKS